MTQQRIGDTNNNVRARRGPRTLGLLAFLAMAVGAPALANASTAANTEITNTATVNYADSGGNAQTPVTATAVVTVALVPSAVALTSPADDSIEQGTSATLTYTITSTANGPDTYNLSASDTLANIAGGGVTFPGGNSVVLGGTTLAADAVNGATTLTVPFDATADVAVNGIVVGDVIIVGGNPYTVTVLSENALANTATITIGTAIAGGTVAAGQIVGERQTFTASVASGTVTAGSSGTHTVATTAVSNTLGTATTTQGTATVVTVTRPSLTVTKLVSVDNGTSFAATGTAAPGTSLIYKIVITNTGVGVATAVDTTDIIPAYLTYVAGSGKQSTSAATTYAAATALTDTNVDGDGYDFGTGTVSYDPGSPGLGTVAGGGGVLVLFFRATVN